jgi:hypothetical protein
MSPVSAFFIRGGMNFAVGQVVDDGVEAQRFGRYGEPDKADCFPVHGQCLPESLVGTLCC